MKKIFQILFLLLIMLDAKSQLPNKQMNDAINILINDSQMKYAMLGFYVVEQKSGKVIINKNGQTGMVPASTQKVLTSLATLDILGSDFRYETDLGYNGKIENGILKGDVYLMGYGDPTLGSSRFDSTNSKIIIAQWIKAFSKNNINQINGNIICFDKIWESQTIPGGWIWDDIGNYYGAGASAINWRENAYEMILQSGKKENDFVNIVSISPELKDIHFTNELKTGKTGSGDNAWIYLSPDSHDGFIRGTIPPNQSAFHISGSLPNPALQLQNELTAEIIKIGMNITFKQTTTNETSVPILTNLLTHYSPTLENMIYWFLRKSINLYGEAFVKTIGFKKNNQGTTSAGIKVLKDYWKEKGIDPNAINIQDGSGLSPSNRVTPEALVKALTFAKSKPWYNIFYNSLPEFNGIKMKSGSMSGVKSFAGYSNGYSFAIIVNNYNGSSKDITQKMYKVLDVIK